MRSAGAVCRRLLAWSLVVWVSGLSAVGAGSDTDIQLGPRPFFLVNDLEDSPLKQRLLRCAGGPFKRTEFSIGHRGAALQFPEHTREAYEAGARMGAGILECDVTFTKDKELVCRHAQDDLATTTNILASPLANKCRVPFTPARFAPDGALESAATAECRTSDLTLAEFKSLRGKMDASNPRARTPVEFLGGTASFRTDLYAGPSSGHLMSHRESIALFKALGVKMIPEVKAAVVPMPFDGFTQEAFVQKLIDEYKAAGVPPSDVFLQSFSRNDIMYVVAHEPLFARQAVYLEGATRPTDLPTASQLADDRRAGVRIVGAPIFALVALDASRQIVPAQYAKDAKAAGLDLIAWTLERSGVLAGSPPEDFYYQTIRPAVQREGDTMRVLSVLAGDVGVRGVFSDWPATVTYYANCEGLP